MSTNAWLTLGYVVAWLCETIGILLGVNLILAYQRLIGPIRLNTQNLRIAGDTEEERLAGRLTLLEFRVGQIEGERDWEALRDRLDGGRQVRATVGFLLVGGAIGLATTLFWIY